MTLADLEKKHDAGALTLNDVLSFINTNPSKRWEGALLFVKPKWNSAVKGAMYRRAKKNA